MFSASNYDQHCILPEICQNLVHEWNISRGSSVGDVLPAFRDHEVPWPEEARLIMFILGISLTLWMSRYHWTGLDWLIQGCAGGGLLTHTFLDTLDTRDLVQPDEDESDIIEILVDEDWPGRNEDETVSSAVNVLMMSAECCTWLLKIRISGAGNKPKPWFNC